MMRPMSSAAGAMLAAAGVIAGVACAPTAWANNLAINGTYTATGIGDWAMTRQVYHDEPVTRSTWKISSSCSTAQDCAGTVVSDQGWTAQLYMHDGLTWFVKRDIPNWEVCEDGTSYSGRSSIIFYPADPVTGENTQDPTAQVFAGRERTTAASGACNVNLPLYIEQPFRLDKIG